MRDDKYGKKHKLVKRTVLKDIAKLHGMKPDDYVCFITAKRLLTAEKDVVYSDYNAEVRLSVDWTPFK